MRRLTIPSSVCWRRPGPDGAALLTLAEVFADSAADGAVTGFALAHLAAGTRILWAQDRLSRREGGRLCAAGIAALFGGSVELLHLEVARPTDVLWAMEEALGCAALDAVVGEVWGDPPVLDFTATKRLALRAERSEALAWLIRRAATPDLSAARERWRVASLPSMPGPDDGRSPGEALWRATLFRSRQRRVGEWVARHDLGSGRLDFVQEAALGAGPVTPRARRRDPAA